MKTSPRLVAALAAATLLLSACGSDDTADTTTGATAAAPSAASSPAEDTSAENSQESTEDAGTADPSTEENTDEGTESSADAGSAGTSSAEPTMIIGGDVDSLDETSTAWFSAMCTGLAPMINVEDTLGQQSSDPAAAAATINQLGTDLVGASETLAGLPAPTFEGGEDIATAVIDGFAQMGQTFQEASTTLAAGDPAALTQLNEAMQSNPLAALQGAQFNPELQDDVRAIPACAPLND